MAAPRRPLQDCRDFQISSSPEVEDNEENLEVIVGPQWRLHWVSPLQDLQYTEARLKQYALHLRGAVQSEEDGTRVEARVRALPELRQDEDTSPALQISVEAVSGENGEKKRQRLYTGIMLSWTKPRRNFEQKNLVHLPLLLCKGGMKAIESVHNTLRVLLNCSIRDLAIEKEHMLWILGIATHFCDGGTDSISLSFNCPGLGDENRLEYTVQTAVLKDVWKSIHGPDKRYITYDDIINLRDKCYTTLQGIYGLNLRMLQLTQIKCKGFLFSVNGRIKFSRELAKLVLNFVLDIGYIQENGLLARFNNAANF